MSGIDNIADDTYMAVTEALALAGQEMDEHQSETILIISLAEDGNNAILGGSISDQAMKQLHGLLEELEEKSNEATGEVLHVWT